MAALGKKSSKRKAAPAPPVFDIGQLRRYTFEDERLERELIGLFLGQLPAILRQIAGAASSHDWKFATHTLKGSARAIGASAIAELAARLEQYEPARVPKRRLAELDRQAEAFSAVARALLD